MKALLCVLVVELVLLAPLLAEPIRSLAELRGLSASQAAKKLPVDVEAQIMKRSPSGMGLFIHDEEAGIYAALTRDKSWSKVGQGDVVRILGTTNKGHFLPSIDVETIEFLEKRPLPAPMKVDRSHLLDPKMDCRWVELEGVVIDSVKTGAVFSLLLSWQGEVINLVLPRPEDFEQRSRKLYNQRVRVRGMAATRWNSRRQMTGRLLQVDSLDDVEVLINQTEEPTLMEIDQLLRMDTGSLAAIRVRGVVTFSDHKLVYLQGAGGSLLVRMPNAVDWEVGTEVEATGTVEVEPFSPALRAWDVKATGEVGDVKAVEFEISEPPLPSSWHQTLVQLDARVLEVQVLQDSVVLQCSRDGHFFSASFSDPARIGLLVEPGSGVRLRGICVLRSSDWRAHNYMADGFSLILRSAGDVTVLSRPPWWSTRRILIASGIAVAVALIALSWVVLLRKRVADQTELIRTQVEREVTMKERERMARNLHDSLEQNIAGLTRTLSTAEQKISTGKLDEVGDVVFLARRMAAHCQRESRESIYDLRQSHQDNSSAQWHDELLLGEAKDLGAEVVYSVEGKPVVRDGATGQRISKIVREAVYNALRHGKAKSVGVTYRETEDGLEVEVRDDGSGFDVEAPPPRGHFGLHGMRERAQHIGGAITIESRLGHGTAVLLKLPLEENSPG